MSTHQMTPNFWWLVITTQMPIKNKDSGTKNDFSTSTAVIIEESKDWLRIFAAVSYTILALVSLIMNFLLLIVFIVGRKRFGKMSFFIISWQTLFCDFTSISYQFIQAIPITFTAQQIYCERSMMLIGTLDTISYNGFLFFMFILAISRFTIFFFTKVDEKLFTTPGIYIIMALTWIFTIAFTVMINVSGCWKEFTTNGYHIFQICNVEWSLLPSPNTTVYAQNFLDNFHYYTANYLPPFGLLIYVSIFVELKLKLTSRLRGLPTAKIFVRTKSFKQEFSILIQSDIICVVFFVENLLYFLPDGRGLQFTTVAQTWTDISLHTMHAVVIFSFNHLARDILKNLLGLGKMPSLNTIVPTVPTKVLRATRSARTKVAVVAAFK